MAFDKTQIIGNKYNRLTILDYRPECKAEGRGHSQVFVSCECGSDPKWVRWDGVKSGRVKSCGCYRIERVMEALQDDLTGQKFGKLTVLSYDHSDKGSYWLCQCDCGNEVVTRAASLKNGSCKSCGCYQREKTLEVLLDDLTNQRFGKLVAIKYAYGTDGAYWVCRCDCGNEKVVRADSLKTGNTKSCGCIGASTMESFFQELLNKEFSNILYEQQWTHEDLKNERLLKVDFCLYINGEPVYVELDGKQHYDDSSNFYSKGLVERDQIKNEFFRSRNDYFFRIPYTPDKDKLREYLQALSTFDLNFLKENCYFYNLKS